MKVQSQTFLALSRNFIAPPGEAVPLVKSPTVDRYEMQGALSSASVAFFGKWNRNEQGLV